MCRILQVHFGGGGSKNLIESSQHTYTHTHTLSHTHWQRFGIVAGYRFLVQKCRRDSKMGLCFTRDMGKQAPEAARPCSESTPWSLFNGTW